VKAKSNSKLKAKRNENETAGNPKRKQSDDEAYRGTHNLTAESLVQQVMPVRGLPISNSDSGHTTPIVAVQLRLHSRNSDYVYGSPPHHQPHCAHLA
jgi:hypothetical protein